MAVGDQQVLDEVLVAQPGGGAARSAAPLRLVDAERLPLRVAAMGDGHHGVFLRDEVLVRQVQLRTQNLRAPFVAVALADVFELLAHHLPLPFLGRQNRQKLLNLLEDFVVFLDQAVLLQGCEAVQPQFQNRLRLRFGEVVEAVVAAPEFVAEVLRPHRLDAGAFQQRLDGLRPPALAHQPGAGFRGVRRRADQFHHFVDVLQRDSLAFEQMAASSRPAQQEHGAPHHHFAAVLQEGIQHVAQIHRARLAVHQRHAVDAEHLLQLRMGVQVVEHDVAVLAAAQFDDHAQTVLVRFVADLGDAFDAPFLHQLGDLLDHLRLVDLVGNLVDDDGFLAAAGVLHPRPGANVDAPAPGAVRLHDAGAAIDDGAGGEVRPLDVLHQAVDGDARVVEQRQAGVHHFDEVVRRNVRRHADGDAGRAVDQQVRHPSRQHLGDLQRFVVVGDGVDRLFIQIREHLAADLRHAHFGVARRGGRVAVDGAEVALAVRQRVAQHEVLRHAHDGLVDGAVAVRVVLRHHFADDVGGFARRPVVEVAQLVHRVEHAPMHRLQAVAHVRQRAGDDDAHRVVEIRLPQLFLDAAGQNLPFRPFWSAGRRGRTGAEVCV